MFNSREMASYIAVMCVKNNIQYNHTKIQKLLYCCYGASLGILNKRLCKDHPYALDYGPVFPYLFKLLINEYDLTQYSDRVKKEGDKQIISIIDKVVKTYGVYNSSTLSRWSCKKGTPWDLIVNHIGKINDVIPDILITNYFINNVLEKEDYCQI